MTTRDPKTKLQAALDILDQFTNLQFFAPPLNHGKGLKIGHIVAFTHHLISSNFVKKTKHELSQGIERALDDVKRYHPIINNSKKPEDIKLSLRACESIHRFNQLIELPKNRQKSWYEKLFFFLRKTSRTLLHNKTTIQLSQDMEPLTPAARTMSAVQNALFKQEEDAFRMKALSLIKQQGILFPSIEEALRCIRETPIYLDSLQERESASIVTLNQTLAPFPGETIVLSGAFKRSSRNFMPTTPISNSFKISATNLHTGHPFPSQHNGWALPDQILPSKVHRPDALPLLKSLLEKKKAIKEGLRSQQSLKKHAHAWLNLKKKAAEGSLNAFVQLHSALCFSMITAAPAYLIPQHADSIICEFFNWIKRQPSPYIALSEQWRAFHELYLCHPYRMLQKSWVEQADAALLSSNPHIAFTSAKTILSDACEKIDESLPDEVGRFFSCMRAILSVPTRNIFLQYFSELIDYPPPNLNSFEKKLQSLACVQLEDYLLEFDSDLPQSPFKNIERSLLYEIELLKGNERRHPLVDKLERYYNARFPL